MFIKINLRRKIREIKIKKKTYQAFFITIILGKYKIKNYRVNIETF